MKIQNNIFSLKNKIVLITGAGRGIGLHLAEKLADYDAKVFTIDKKFTKKPIKNLSQIECDITNQDEFKKVCNQIFKQKKRIDVLINNAGISLANKETGKDYSIEKWNETLRINLTAHFTCSQEVIRYMKKQKSGSIINITSINAELGFPRNPSYVASKGGLKMLGKALAKDWGKFGIRVNNLGPGYIKTDMTSKTYSNKKLREQRKMHTMLDRWGEKDDLVGPCIFLASDASKYVTGQDLYVDGGWIANSIVTE
jgi:Dehydrogenases with different specificities (related to short-chain alcohol dehydrogenases)